MIESFYRMTGEIHRKTKASDGMGGSTTSWVAIMTSRGVLDLASGNEIYKASKIMAEATHTWFCQPLTLLIEDPAEQTSYFGVPFQASPYRSAMPAPILNTDRLVVDGINYEILDVDDPMNMGHHLEIAVRRLESGQV